MLRITDNRLWKDARAAVRVCLRSPGFTAIAVLSIAFGAGANVAIFSVADALLLRPLPVPRASELVTVGTRLDQGLRTIHVGSYPDYTDIRDRARSFDGLLAFTTRPVGFAAASNAAAQVRVVSLVSGNFFRTLGVTPAIGRDFRAGEDLVAGRDAVAILSHTAWQKELGGDAAAIGRTVRIGDVDFTVIGVLPQAFTGLEQRYLPPAAYVPLAMTSRLASGAAPDLLTSRGLRSLTLKGRLKTGVTLAEARAELSGIGQALQREHPDTNADAALTAQTEFDVRFASHPIDMAALMVLAMLSWVVLLVACANVAALLASRAPVRARDIALRLAIGATRGSLVRQLFAESLTIAVAGAAAGLAVGYAGIVLLRRIELPTEIAARPPFELDGRALAFSLLIAVASALLFGLGPALAATRVDLITTLKVVDPGMAPRRRLSGRNALVSIQIALSLVLLTMALYAVQVFDRILADGPGFRTARMAKITIDVTGAGGDRRAHDLLARAAEDARRLPGVTSVGLAARMPFSGFDLASVIPEGYRGPSGTGAVPAYANAVDEGYFTTMQIGLVAGRDFRPTDSADGPAVAIVNEAFARRYWPSGGTVGRRFRMGDASDRFVQIVGVVRTSTYVYPGEPPLDMIYFPLRQQPPRHTVLLAAASGESAALLEPLRDVVRHLPCCAGVAGGREDATVPVYDVQTIETFYAARAQQLADVLQTLIVAMGLMGLTLSVVALYGLVAYAVSHRTREIAIRTAVGANQRRILRMVMQEGMRPVWVGLAAGLGLSVLTARLMPALAPFNHQYEYDPVLNVLVVPALIAVTLLAALIPARRATRVEPTVALRCE